MKKVCHINNLAAGLGVANPLISYAFLRLHLGLVAIKCISVTVKPIIKVTQELLRFLIRDLTARHVLNPLAIHIAHLGTPLLMTYI